MYACMFMSGERWGGDRQLFGEEAASTQFLYIYIHIHIHIHIHKYIHTYIHTYTHTHTHTYVVLIIIYWEGGVGKVLEKRPQAGG